MKTITCIGKDEMTYNFKYSYSIEQDNGKNIWEFIVIPENEIYTDFFFFSATEILDNSIKVTMINKNNQVDYSAKGIPEKILSELQMLSDKVIISSTNNPVYKSFDEEYRTLQATKVWNRLLNRGEAIYDENTDTYTLLKE